MLRHAIKTSAARLGIFSAARAVEAYFNALRGHVHDPDYVVLTEFVGSGDIADIGANIGQSVVSLHRLFPGSRIHAFEPNPQCRKVLDRVIRIARANADVTACGLGRERDTLVFSVPVTRDGVELLQEGSFDSSVFDEPITRSRIGADFSLKRLSVPIARLDDFPGKYSLLKIDVQGLEMAVLEGAGETIRRDRPVIFLERDARVEADISSFLSHLGYEPRILTNNAMYLPK